MLKNRTSAFLILLTLGWTTVGALAEPKCGAFQIRYRHQNQWVTETLEACSQKSPQGLLLTSSSCADQCAMKSTLQKTVIPENQIFRETGSPHFHVCHIMGWQPKILEVQIGTEWKKTAICEDLNTSEFLDANTLLKIVLRK